jgi:hypothetical protein
LSVADIGLTLTETGLEEPPQEASPTARKLKRQICKYRITGIRVTLHGLELPAGEKVGFEGWDVADNAPSCGRKQKKPLIGGLLEGAWLLVAGAGFEPATFGL